MGCPSVGLGALLEPLLLHGCPWVVSTAVVPPRCVSPWHWSSDTAVMGVTPLPPPPLLSLLGWNPAALPARDKEHLVNPRLRCANSEGGGCWEALAKGFVPWKRGMGPGIWHRSAFTVAPELFLFLVSSGALRGQGKLPVQPPGTRNSPSTARCPAVGAAVGLCLCCSGAGDSLCATSPTHSRSRAAQGARN